MFFTIRLLKLPISGNPKSNKLSLMVFLLTLRGENLKMMFSNARGDMIKPYQTFFLNICRCWVFRWFQHEIWPRLSDEMDIPPKHWRLWDSNNSPATSVFCWLAKWAWSVRPAIEKKGGVNYQVAISEWQQTKQYFEEGFLFPLLKV